MRTRAMVSVVGALLLASCSDSSRAPANEVEFTVNGFPKADGQYIVKSSTCPFALPLSTFTVGQADGDLTIVLSTTATLGISNQKPVVPNSATIGGPGATGAIGTTGATSSGTTSQPTVNSGGTVPTVPYKGGGPTNTQQPTGDQVYQPTGNIATIAQDGTLNASIQVGDAKFTCSGRYQVKTLSLSCIRAATTALTCSMFGELQGGTGVTPSPNGTTLTPLGGAPLAPKPAPATTPTGDVPLPIPSTGQLVNPALPKSE